MILVTGASGHIGNVLVRELLGRGERVRALVRPGNTPPALAGLEVELAVGDILDMDSLERALQGVNLVYHLAARISLADGPDPETERVNLEGTRNLIAAMRQLGTGAPGLCQFHLRLEGTSRRVPPLTKRSPLTRSKVGRLRPFQSPGFPGSPGSRGGRAGCGHRLPDGGHRAV